ncbi:hypothetical protein [Vagococcus fluvialis]|uniref:hypothetical protein n=1 Tax=Vagococcus fluvialis TaxID=2738 RepID=UPI003D12DF1C
MKKYMKYGIIILLVIILGYSVETYQKEKFNNSSEGLKQSFFKEYEEVIKYEKFHESSNDYEIMLKQEFFDRDIQGQMKFLFTLYDNYIDKALTDDEKELSEYISLSIYPETKEDKEEINVFLGNDTVYRVDKDEINFNQLSGSVDRTLEIPLFMHNGTYYEATNNEILYGVNEELKLEDRSKNVKDSWTTSSGEDITKMDSKEIEKELNKRFKEKSEDYNSKGEYKPVDSMTQKEIQDDLEDMLNESLK